MFARTHFETKIANVEVLAKTLALWVEYSFLRFLTVRAKPQK